MSVTALIAEDEGPQRRALVRLLTNAWPELKVVAECEDGDAAVAALQSRRPSIAFLDIRMAGKDGLEVAQKASPATQVVFTTAYEEHALRAFELGATDYILKPVTADRLAATVLRLRSRLEGSQHSSALPADASEQSIGPHKSKLAWITATLGNAIKLIDVRRVMFFQANASCTRVVTDTGEAIIRMPLYELRERLDPEVFWQIHRGFIVQIGAIKTVRRNEIGKLEVTVNGCDEILPVSQTFQHRFRGM
jgi:DNA-binding LytR/AlgR family response regulator